MDNGHGKQDTLEDLAALADELLEQAAEIRRQWAELADTLGVDAPQAAPVPPRLVPDESEADPVRLVALDMVLSGHSRDAVRDYLRATFGEGDREAVLDEVFAQYAGE